MAVGNERTEPTVLEDLEEVRETILEFDSRLDRSGARWEELRIRLDLRLRLIGARIREDEQALRVSPSAAGCRLPAAGFRPPSWDDL